MGSPEIRDILLDTHVWIWVSLEREDLLTLKVKNSLKGSRRRWISAISCWELAKLVEKKRIAFSIPLITWIRRSLFEYNISIAELSPEITTESIQLGEFHKDPADQIIVATSRIFRYDMKGAWW